MRVSNPQGLINDDEVGVQSVDGVYGYTYTFTTLMPDGQPEVFMVGMLADGKPGRGFYVHR